MTQEIKTSDLTIMWNWRMCYAWWYDTEKEALKSFLYLFYAISGHLTYTVSYLFKREIEYCVERSECWNKYRAYIQEVF